MTTYAYDAERRQLLAVWPSGFGHRATTVTDRIPADADESLVSQLCATLTALSEVLWDTYVHPASATEDETEHEQAEQERERISGVAAALREPNLPTDGMLLVSYSPVEESAHRAGRALHELASADLTADVVTAVQAEIGFIEQAELGDLSGRAAQATVLDRVDTSPVQVDAADALLEKNPLGSTDLFTSFDPVSACVAAAHWLAAAATVSADQAEIDPTDVFSESAGIETCSIEVPATVVESIDSEGETPRDAVVRMVRDALLVKDGQIPSLAELLAQTTAAIAQAELLPEASRGEAVQSLPRRITPLDPQRPARDLLEHLLDGIRASLTLFDEYVGYDEESGAPVIGDEQLPHPYGGAWTRPSSDGEGEDLDYTEAVNAAVQEEFIAQVRDEAASTRERLG